MAFFDRLDIFAQVLKQEFLKAYDSYVIVPPIADAVTVMGSKGRVENYPWMYPPPLLANWNGWRDFVRLGTTNYRVPNKTWSAGVEINKEDFDDDQVDGFRHQVAMFAESGKDYKWLEVQTNMANGQSITCFDGTNFFNTSHTIGTGNNIVTGTAGSTDGVTHAMVVLITANARVKPLMWQDREPLNFKTDMGSLEADKKRIYPWWTDMRGAPAFGFWWDAILVKFANTPTVAEMQTTLGTVNSTFKQFTFPKNRPQDKTLYIHGQTQFTDKNVLIANSSKLDHIVRQALTLTLIGASENWFKNWARNVTSGYLDAVV